MSSSSHSSKGRRLAVLPLLLVSRLAAAAPLPSEPTTSVLPTLFIPYPAVTGVSTTDLPSASSAFHVDTETSSMTQAEADWPTVPTASSAYIDSQSLPSDPSMVPVLVEGGTSDDAYAASPTPTASWALPPTFSDMSPFKVSTYAAGKHNMAILQGSPMKSSADGGNFTEDEWDASRNALQILYPQGSINPGNKPQGGSEFYATPLDVTRATNASLEYSVYFPHDFDFVKGGKLPGLYGGHKGCSGGNAAEDCFSTRLMWRAGGQGELYLYVPKDKQTPQLCQTPPKSICESTYGLSIGRGAWTFAKGDWTTVRQDIWLNTPGQNDGGFNIWVNGQLVITANDVRYRENGDSCIQGENGDAGDASSAAIINTIGFGGGNLSDSTIDYINEDWQVSESAITNTSKDIAATTSTSIIGTVTVTSTLPPIGAYATSYSIPSASASASASTSPALSNSASTSTITSSALSSASTSASALRRRDDQTSTSCSSSAADAAPTEHALLITIPITDSITTVTALASPTTQYITVPTTVLATDFITNAVTVTPSATTDTVYVTESNTRIPTSVTVTPTDPTTPFAIDLSNKAILINQEAEPTTSQPALLQSTGNSLQQPIILKSPPGQIVKSHEDLKSGIQSQYGCGVGFIGLFFSTFFGGHTQDWASPKDQYTYFRDFKMWINQ
ncbi:uncharacterized protein I303_104741 [Kwoniella dejecticola CBS 10117]|uniref:Polysaccharide lyase 14 domain-containing protein n=1 Tax=Kwoniella dejecticola CBS 10117 TaxID=1296121 RepID=A0A1A6A4G9_9TREE|nr:uncharacterized protein I303_04279 [Kwoniella dejecticola CBS 10117]OBR84954.1 hypothetical protein I303_04279 [Kwoniella dejecticola CBS 10117]